MVGYPAISRKDNKTEICSTCGLLEALDAYKKGVRNSSIPFYYCLKKADVLANITRSLGIFLVHIGFNSSKVKLKDFTYSSRRLNYNNYKSLKTELELRIFG